MPFCAIQAATNHNVRFLLKHRTDLGRIECAALKLESYHASIALYRSITEKHAFYSCETVRSAVTSQFVRDLKGTIASFFNENTDLGTLHFIRSKSEKRKAKSEKRIYQILTKFLTKIQAKSTSLTFSALAAKCTTTLAALCIRRIRRVRDLCCRRYPYRARHLRAPMQRARYNQKQ